MLKKLIYTALIALSIIFISTFCLAAENIGNMATDAKDSVRNAVGGAENVLENAANSVGNMIHSGTNAVENAGNKMTEGIQNMTGSSNSTISSSNNNSYTATRTSTGESTFMRMGSTAWTWLILGIAAIAIVALVWYYSMQFTTNKNNDKY